jgi:hypothetical protein
LPFSLLQEHAAHKAATQEFESNGKCQHNQALLRIDKGRKRVSTTAKKAIAIIIIILHFLAVSEPTMKPSVVLALMFFEE